MIKLILKDLWKLFDKYVVVIPLLRIIFLIFKAMTFFKESNPQWFDKIWMVFWFIGLCCILIMIIVWIVISIKKSIKYFKKIYKQSKK